MSLFNLPVTHKQNKTVSEHPWAKTIKEHYANKIKSGHNSVRNMVYPRLKERIPLGKRVTFTVIGNRVTKEFIYCVKMVRGMHRYKWKHYNVPVIRGCTAVEWPNILHELNNCTGFKHCEYIQAAVLRNGEFIGGEQELKELIESQYVYHLVLNYQKESLKYFSHYLKASGRPCVYIHISIEKKPIGSLIFMLYSDIAPVTCENFLRLCQAKRGGYSGTSVHRIVKDGWIQCGGFGLKNTNMDCENFIVAHDKRGVLGMANAGRHIDCSTQFYVLLQPNEWLKSKFTAFGQLIEGEETLKKIEEVSTYYEAPTSSITIYKTGIVNLDCQDIRINKGALEYLDGHVEDLVTIGEMFYEMLLEKVWLEIEFRNIQGLEQTVCEEDDYGEAFKEAIDAFGNIIKKHIQATRRYVHRKDKTQAIQNIQKSEATNNENKRVTINKHNKVQNNIASSTESEFKSTKDNDNMQFDVDEYNSDYTYEYAQDEESYVQITPIPFPKASKPHIIPWSDVPYLGEADSNFDLKRFLQGDYCLESDLEPSNLKIPSKKPTLNRHKLNAVSLFISMQSDIEDRKISMNSLDDEERMEIFNYLSMYGDKVSFAGGNVQEMAKQSIKLHPLEEKGSQEWFTDEDIRMMRMLKRDYKESKKSVSFTAPMSKVSTIKRRLTGFLRPEQSINMYRKQHEGEEIEEKDLKKLEKDTTIELGDCPQKKQYGHTRVSDAKPNQKQFVYEEEQEYYKKHKSETRDKVRILPDATLKVSQQRVSPPRRSNYSEIHPTTNNRQSVLLRLFEDVDMPDKGAAPKLKDFKPHDEIGKKKMKLAVSDSAIQFSTILRREKQHLSDSNDTVISNFDEEKRPSMRPSLARLSLARPSIQFTRIKIKTCQPMISVSEYQRKNDARREQAKKLDVDLKKRTLYSGSVRLPGDTPLYSPKVSILSP